MENTRTVRLKPQKSWEPSGEKQSEWAAVSSSWEEDRDEKMPSKASQLSSRKESWARMSLGWAGGPYQVVVSAKGSPELSSECIPDVNRVLPAAAGHTENNKDIEPQGCQRKGRKPTDQSSQLPFEGHIKPGVSAHPEIPGQPLTLSVEGALETVGGSSRSQGHHLLGGVWLG